MACKKGKIHHYLLEGQGRKAWGECKYCHQRKYHDPGDDPGHPITYRKAGQLSAAEYSGYGKYSRGSQN
jgi:hypothetical protein